MGYLKEIRRNVDDALDGAGDAYGDFKDEFGRRARRVWRNRDDYLDDAVSAAEDLGDVITERFRRDPLGTIAIGAILFWLVTRTVRRSS